MRQAQLAARVQYGDQVSSTRELIKEARRDLRGSLQAGEGAAEGVRAAVDAAKPAMVSIYQRTGMDARAANRQINADLAKLGGAADPFKAATMLEQSGARRRISENLGYALQELQQRGIQARAGRAYAAQNALRQYSATRDKLNSQLTAQRRQQGLYAAQQVGVLRRQQSQDSLARQSLDLRKQTAGETARHNRATEGLSAARAAKGGRGGGLKPLSLLESRAFVDQIDKALGYAAAAQRKGKADDAIKGVLTGALPPPVDRTTLRPIKVPQVPGSAVDIALELTRGGTLSPQTFRRLIGKYGVDPGTIPPQWRPNPSVWHPPRKHYPGP